MLVWQAWWKQNWIGPAKYVAVASGILQGEFFQIWCFEIASEAISSALSVALGRLDSDSIRHLYICSDSNIAYNMIPDPGSTKFMADKHAYFQPAQACGRSKNLGKSQKLVWIWPEQPDRLHWPCSSDTSYHLASEEKHWNFHNLILQYKIAHSTLPETIFLHLFLGTDNVSKYSGAGCMPWI